MRACRRKAPITQPPMKTLTEGETVATSKAAALQRLTEISRKVSGRMAADGIVTDGDKQAFIDSLYDNEGEHQAELRQAITDARNGVGMSPAFDTAEAAIAYLRSLPADVE